MKRTKDIIIEAMEARVVNTPVQLPDTINGKRPRLVSVRDHIVTVQESNPIEFLIKAMQSGVITSAIVDENGNVEQFHSPVMPKDRINIAKYLASKLMPSMQLVKVVKSDDGDEEVNEPKGFDALVQRAVTRGRQTS